MSHHRGTEKLDRKVFPDWLAAKIPPPTAQKCQARRP